MLITKIDKNKNRINLVVYVPNLEKSSHLNQETEDYISKRTLANPNDKYPEINIGILWSETRAKLAEAAFKEEFKGKLYRKLSEYIVTWDTLNCDNFNDKYEKLTHCQRLYLLWVYIKFNESPNAKLIFKDLFDQLKGDNFTPAKCCRTANGIVIKDASSLVTKALLEDLGLFSLHSGLMAIPANKNMLLTLVHGRLRGAKSILETSKKAHNFLSCIAYSHTYLNQFSNMLNSLQDIVISCTLRRMQTLFPNSNDISRNFYIDGTWFKSRGVPDKGRNTSSSDEELLSAYFTKDGDGGHKIKAFLAVDDSSNYIVNIHEDKGDVTDFPHSYEAYDELSKSIISYNNDRQLIEELIQQTIAVIGDRGIISNSFKFETVMRLGGYVGSCKANTDSYSEGLYSTFNVLLNLSPKLLAWWTNLIQAAVKAKNAEEKREVFASFNEEVYAEINSILRSKFSLNKAIQNYAKSQGQELVVGSNGKTEIVFQPLITQLASDVLQMTEKKVKSTFPCRNVIYLENIHWVSSGQLVMNYNHKITLYQHKDYSYLPMIPAPAIDTNGEMTYTTQDPIEIDEMYLICFSAGILKNYSESIVERLNKTSNINKEDLLSILNKATGTLVENFEADVINEKKSKTKPNSKQVAKKSAQAGILVIVTNLIEANPLNIYYAYRNRYRVEQANRFIKSNLLHRSLMVNRRNSVVGRLITLMIAHNLTQDMLKAYPKKVDGSKTTPDNILEFLDQMKLVSVRGYNFMCFQSEDARRLFNNITGQSLEMDQLLSDSQVKQVIDNTYDKNAKLISAFSKGWGLFYKTAKRYQEGATVEQVIIENQWNR